MKTTYSTRKTATDTASVETVNETGTHHRESIMTPVKKEARRPQKQTKAIVAVVGLGYVGLPLAIAADAYGYDVIGFDIDPAKISKLAARDVDFLSEEESAAFDDSLLRITANEAVLREADIAIICVPTPVSNDHTPDLVPLRSASVLVGRNLKKGALVVVESTVNPGACEAVAIPVIESVSGFTAGRDFFFAHCPERINPGDGFYNVENIPRVVGGIDDESAERAETFYRSIMSADVMRMNGIKEAEAVKMVENSFRDINIAFVNELAMAFSKAGIDIVNVIHGAETKPFGFMPHYPGCGVGGHCIPVDPYYLITYGRENGFTHRLLMTARNINNGMPHHTVGIAAKALREKGKKMRGARIALLGLAYKRDIGDMRESPALVIRDELAARGATVRSFDPYVPKESTVESIEDALSGADALVIATDHSMFRGISPSLLLKHGVSVVVDGRNCLSKALFESEGIWYRGIGR